MYQDILTFWFEELEPKDWFVSNADVDKQIETRFLTTLEQAAQSELFDWRETAQGRLAEIIVLDQFSRNVYRNTPKAFAQDALALALAQETIRLGLDQELTDVERSFCICHLCTVNLSGFMKRQKSCSKRLGENLTTSSN